MYDTDIMAPRLTFDKVKLPSTSVMVLRLVPSTATVAPIMASPFSSTTFPLTCIRSFIVSKTSVLVAAAGRQLSVPPVSISINSACLLKSILKTLWLSIVSDAKIDIFYYNYVTSS